MANPLSNKKKIRGWKTQYKRLEKWEKTNMNLDIEELKNQKRAYVKIWIDPWDRLVKRNPPVWFCKDILKALIEIYWSWENTLKELNQPYYLKIWVFDPHFYNSQVVAAIDDSLDFYNNAFHKTESDIEFPYHKYSSTDIDLKKFTWASFLEEDFYYEKADELPDYFINKLRKKHHKDEIIEINGEKDVCITLTKGLIWIGSKV